MPVAVGEGIRPERDAVRYRLDVVAFDVIDVVAFAGGWLFDRGAAGWDIAALVANPGDSRPLRILGAEMVDLERVLASGGEGRRPDALAIAADVIERDSRAHDGLIRALGDSGIEVVVWGESWMSPPEHRVERVVHRLSIAAQAFKAHAFAAAGHRDMAVEPTEIFRTDVSAFRPFGVDLTPVA